MAPESFHLSPIIIALSWPAQTHDPSKMDMLSPQYIAFLTIGISTALMMMVMRNDDVDAAADLVYIEGDFDDDVIVKKTSNCVQKKFQIEKFQLIMIL